MSELKVAWANRIVGSGEMPPAELMKAANPKNPRIHPDYQADALEQVLDEVGFIDRVILNRTTGRLIDGHLRVKMALAKGMSSIPVEYVELNEAEEKLVLATFDPIAGLADFDIDKLAALSEDVKLDFDVDLEDFFSDDAGFDFGDNSAADEGRDTEAAIDKATELQAQYSTALGQLWQLGEHRLIVGDCTDAATVERLMNGEKAEMVFTDPPYGVAVGDKNKFLNSIARSNRVEENLQNDDISEPELTDMLCKSFDNAMGVCLTGGAWYVAAPAGPLHVLFGQVLKDRGIWRQTIQWVKNNATFSPMGVDYHWRAEPIFYGWMPGAAHRYYGGRQQTTVWEIDRPMKSPEHPTMKPIELPERAMANSSKDNETVYDPFVGSGTTILAAHNLGRIARACEIDPGYAAVTIHRWEKHTGGKAELIDG